MNPISININAQWPAFFCVTTININGLCSGPSKLEADRDSHYDTLNTAMSGCYYGRHSLPVGLVMSPEERFRARVAKQENVDALEQSILQFGSVNEHIEVVLFLGPSKTAPPRNGFQAPLTVEELKRRGFEGYFAIAGDHTQRAMNQLHKRFSKNPKWATLGGEGVYLSTKQRNLHGPEELGHSG